MNGCEDGREDLDRRLALADRVFVSLVGAPPSAVRLLSTALRLADGLIGRFADPFAFYDGQADRLARLQMAYRLRRVARHPDCEALLGRLAVADAAPWPEIRMALVAIRALDGVQHTTNGASDG